MADPKTVVLVHGAWHGAWCWDKVTALLDAAGIPVVAFDLPFTSFEDDVTTTTAALDRVDGPIVLCGHSYGGAVITAAGSHPSVEHLVYLTAFALDKGESPAATATDADLPGTELGSAFILHDDGTATLERQGAIDALYHDCDPADVDATLAQLRPIHMSCFTTPAGAPAWSTTPSTYVVCAEDRGIHPALQRHMAARCSAVVELPTAHSPFLNRPDLVAGVLIPLAT
jgi:pimeloyl-ACP methyl ester carboxylesterase